MLFVFSYPALCPAQPAEGPPASPAPARVESVAGGRWSPGLGFVTAATLPPSAPGDDARLSVIETRPSAPPVRDTGSGAAPSSDEPAEESKPVSALYVGAGRIGFAPEAPARSGPGVQEATFSESSGTEIVTGGKWVIPGGERIGGWLGFAMSFAFGDVETTRDGTIEKYSVLSIPISLRTGLDVHIVRYVDIGPRIGAQVGPYKLSQDTSDSSSSSSSSTTSSESAFLFFYEYGAQARLKLGTFSLEPALVWRNSADVTGQYLTANAMFGVGSVYLMGWWETRLSTDGQPERGSSAETFAAGLPDESRLGAGIALSLL